MSTLSLLQIVTVLLAYAVLTGCFVLDDFSVQYVAHSSNSALPWFYKITAVWGAHEGSLLLWLTVLNIWHLAIYVVAIRKRWASTLTTCALTVMGALNFGLLILLVHTSNPFARYILNPPLDGADLNPMLQDLAMIIHPPILYIGYVGTAAAFAITIARLWQQKIDSAWAVLLKPWVQTAWVFLTLGIGLGSWWAYYELGWGGWWFWDPVENASFMPWLTATALLHTLSSAARRGKFLDVAVLLTIITFALSIFGTFLVRSGIISSVHAFAHDPTRGKLILQLLLCWCGGAFALYALRRHISQTSSKWSKEDFSILLNNILLIIAAISIMLGTIYPLLPFASVQRDASVGVAYYNAVFIPLMIAMLLVMLFSFFRLHHLILVLPVTAVLSAGLLWMLFFEINLSAWLGVTLALGLAGSAIQSKRVFMLCGHLGLAVTIIGISINGSYERETELAMHVGSEYIFAKRSFYLQNVNVFDGPNYVAYQASIEMDGKSILFPEKRMYLARELVMNEVAISPGLFNDVYVVLGQNISEGVWAVRIANKPFVRWIWAGIVIMTLGFLAEICRKIYKPGYVNLLCAMKSVTEKVAY